MEQHDTSTQATTIIQGALRACELRVERRVSDAQGQEQIEFRCGASGGPEQGYVIARDDEDLSLMLSICKSCPIPDALESRHACLNLVPTRVFPGGKRALPVIQPQTGQQGEPEGAYFSCRWFYSLYGQQQPRDISMCRNCPHWFPRPPRELIPEYWPITHKMLRIVSGEESTARAPTGFTPAAWVPPRTWWQRLLHKFHL